MKLLTDVPGIMFLAGAGLMLEKQLSAVTLLPGDDRHPAVRSQHRTSELGAGQSPSFRTLLARSEEITRFSPRFLDNFRYRSALWLVVFNGSK
jgi:hypothetical protein